MRPYDSNYFQLLWAIDSCPHITFTQANRWLKIVMGHRQSGEAFGE